MELFFNKLKKINEELCINNEIVNKIDFLKEKKLWYKAKEESDKKNKRIINTIYISLVELYRKSTVQEIKEIRSLLVPLECLRNGIYFGSNMQTDATEYLKEELLKVIIANGEDLYEVGMGLKDDVKFAQDNNIDYQSVFMELADKADDTVYEWHLEDIQSMRNLFLIIAKNG